MGVGAQGEKLTRGENTFQGVASRRLLSRWG
nr:MAG TPA: hypothetical protein [Caudoviricetes sp.]